MPPKDTPTDVGLLPIGEAADRAGVSIDTLRRWADQGRLRTYRTPGGQRRFRAEDIDGLYRVETPSGDAA